MGIGQRSGQCIGSVDFTIIHSTWDDCGGTSHGGRYSEYGYVTSSDLVFSSRFSGFSSVSLVWCSVGETKAGLIWITTGCICSIGRDERFPYVSVVNSLVHKVLLMGEWDPRKCGGNQSLFCH